MNANKMSANQVKESSYRVQVIDRALGVLEALAGEGQPMSLVKLSKRLGLPKSTTMRLLMVLEGHRFVEKSSESGLYRLGLKLFELGQMGLTAVREDRRVPMLTAYLHVESACSLAQLDRPELARSSLAAGRDGWEPPDDF